MCMIKKFIGRIFILLVCAVSMLITQYSYANSESGEKLRGWWSQEYTVHRDDAKGTLVLSTPYYKILHDLKKGGAISKISLTHGKAENLLVQPIETSVQLVSKGEPGAERDARTRLIFRDINDTTPQPPLSL